MERAVALLWHMNDMSCHGITMSRLMAMPWQLFICVYALYMKLIVNCFYDSRPQNQRFSFTNALWLLDTRTDDMKNKNSYIFLFAKDCRTMTSGWQGAPYFRRYGRELVFKTGDSVKEMLGGANVAPLSSNHQPPAQ